MSSINNLPPLPPQYGLGVSASNLGAGDIFPGASEDFQQIEAAMEQLNADLNASPPIYNTLYQDFTTLVDKYNTLVTNLNFPLPKFGTAIGQIEQDIVNGRFAQAKSDFSSLTDAANTVLDLMNFVDSCNQLTNALQAPSPNRAAIQTYFGIFNAWLTVLSGATEGTPFQKDLLNGMDQFKEELQGYINSGDWSDFKSAFSNFTDFFAGITNMEFPG